jgi:hypothetical protein
VRVVRDLPIQPSPERQVANHAYTLEVAVVPVTRLGELAVDNRDYVA